MQSAGLQDSPEDLDGLRQSSMIGSTTLCEILFPATPTIQGWEHGLEQDPGIVRKTRRDGYQGRHLVFGGLGGQYHDRAVVPGPEASPLSYGVAVTQENRTRCPVR